MVSRKRTAQWGPALAALAAVVTALAQQPAEARILLKPKGEETRALRMKALEANVDIEGQFATTKTIMTFQNELGGQMEADFIYTLPEGSVATYFAYWYGKEKVVARIVEKDRAAGIYKRITTRMQDPALVELIGKNTFRARIFPVMPNEDLRIEMHSVETMPSRSGGARYTYALAPEVKGTGTLDKLEIAVRVKRDANLLAVANDLGLPVTADNSQLSMHLNQTNFRPQRDLHVGLKYRRTALQAKLLAAPSGGRDGFFALALTPSSNAKAGKLKFDGIKVYDVLPRRLVGLREGRQVTIVGRYRAASDTTATVHLGQLKSQIRFTTAPRNENAASSLWAARTIADLSSKERNQARVVALSHRFNLPSKWTSWLAIPTEERKRFSLEKARADFTYYTRRLAQEVAKPHVDRALVQNLKGQYDRSLVELRGIDPRNDEFGDEQIYTFREDLADVYIMARRTHNAKSLEIASRSLKIAEPDQAHRNQLIAESAGRNRTAKENAHIQRVNQLLKKSSDQIADEIIAGRLHESRVARLQEERKNLKDRNAISYDESEDNRYGALSSRASIVSFKIVQEKQAALPDQEKLAAWQDELADLKKESGGYLDMSAHLEWARQQIANGQKAFGQADARKMYLSQNWGHGGDPLVLVEAPADAQQVVAILPDGSVKPLAYDNVTKRWETRFDVPMYTKEGSFDITVIIVAKDGTRRSMKLHYDVDLTAPRGQGLAQRNKNGKWNLQVQGDDDTARVSALLPSGEKVELKPSAQEAHRFVGLVDMPQNEAANTPPVVTYILTDRAHNRTQITVDLSH